MTKHQPMLTSLLAAAFLPAEPLPAALADAWATDEVGSRWADRFENEWIVLEHLSTRTAMRLAQAALDKRLPKGLKDRVYLWED